MGMIFLFLIETWVLDKIYFYDSFLTIKNCLKLLKIVVHKKWCFYFWLRIKNLSQSAGKHTINRVAFNLEYFLLIPDVYRSSFFATEHIPKYGDHGKILCVFSKRQHFWCYLGQFVNHSQCGLTGDL